jgi:quinol monooxygenase YgiN
MEKIYGFVEVAIPEGRAQDFIAGARACHEAALPDLTGTQVYDWFLSEDGRSAWVLEVYDDPAALAHHSRMMAGRVDRLLAIAEFRMTFAGLVPQALQDRMRQRLTATGWFGRRAHGLMTQPTPHRVPHGDPICALAWFTPREGQAETLRALAAESFAQARDHDPGTLGYEWFIDDTGRVLAMDIYADAAAMAAHMQNCGPIMARILQIADSRTLLFGDLPEALRGRLKPELGVQVFGRRLHGVT